MYKNLSGAKSVKQYRGDENLPEAKNGMKKGCGCKHSKSKYKYQSGERDIAADKLEYGDDYETALANNFKGEELELPEGNAPLTYAPKTQKVSKTKPVVTKNTNVKKPIVKKSIVTKNLQEEPLLKSGLIVDKNTNIAKIYANDPRKNKTINVLTGQNRDGKITAKSLEEAEKNPSLRITPAGYYKMRPFNNKAELTKFNGKLKALTPIAVGNRPAPPEWPAFHQTYNPAVRDKLYGTKNSNASYGCINARPEDYDYTLNNLDQNDTTLVLDSRNKNDKILLDRYAQREKQQKNSSMTGKISKYKYGTGALTIPEGSAIVTANKGKNKQALMAYKKGNYKLLNNIIDDMPEDNVDKKQAGAESLEAKYKRLGELTGPLSPAQQKEFDDVKSQLTEDEYDIYDDKRIAEKFGQKYDVDKAKWKSSLKGGKLNLKEDTDNANYRESLRDPKVLKAAIAAGKVKVDAKGNISYTAIGDSAKGNQEFLGTTKKGTLPTLQGSEDLKKGPPPSTVPPDKKKPDNNRKGFDIPSLAEVAARSSILGQGVEGVPENYLKLGRYNYASQLDRTLRENAVAANTAKENIRDVVGGSAGSYLSNVANITGKRFDANAGAVTQDTLARQDILNKNVDLGNTEAQVNTGLKNQYAELRGKARSNYNDQLVALGQRIDSATETAQEMSNQRGADDQRMQVLKDLGLNYEYKNVDGLMKLVPKVPVNTPPTTTGTPDAVSKKGLKKVKTYKRR